MSFPNDAARVDGRAGDAPRRVVLAGRIVTVDDAFHTHTRGRLYIEAGRIAAVQAAGAPPPRGFLGIEPIETQGILFPGLIDLHNHLAYDVLRLWAVPRRYDNRGQWAAAPSYRREVTAPMAVLGASPDLLPAIARYVECKCLVGGTTTTQGLALFSNAGVHRYYRGLVRHVEETGALDLPDAVSRIADVEAAHVGAFRERLGKSSCLFLHLSEGTNDTARRHFLALKDAAGWAVGPQLAAIHAVALERADFDVLARAGASIVWSPFSNFLLYGATTRIADAKAAGVRITLGPDWSYSGSKNLLGELKVARLASEAAGGALSDRELVAAATRSAAETLRWDAALGTLERGKRADVLVIRDPGGDPYRALLRATEADVALVLVDGEARYGTPDLAKQLGGSFEALRVGGELRRVAVASPGKDPAIPAVSLTHAIAELRDALHRLPELARTAARPNARARSGATWFLDLRELERTGDAPASRAALAAAASPPLSELVAPMDLDPLTAVDDAALADLVATEANLPPGVVAGLRALAAPAARERRRA